MEIKYHNLDKVYSSWQVTKNGPNLLYFHYSTTKNKEVYKLIFLYLYQMELKWNISALKSVILSKENNDINDVQFLNSSKAVIRHYMIYTLVLLVFLNKKYFVYFVSWRVASV